MSSSPSFVLTAYAGTGKDTFFAEIASGGLSLYGPTVAKHEPRWTVYAAESRDSTDFMKLLTCRPHTDKLDARQAPPRAKRYAFADVLKKETHRWLGFQGDIPALAFEKVKDTLTARDPESGNAATLRQHYINYGQARRRENPFAWAAPVAAQIHRDLYIDYPGPCPVDITTDWRFDNELEPRDRPPSTIRLYREEVKVAPVLADRNTDSEHNLDNYLTDYLLVPPGQFAAALKAFPQYANYTPRFILVKK